MRKALHPYAALSVVAAVLLGLTGCGAAKSPSEASRKPVVQVVERDFHIKAPERVPAREPGGGKLQPLCDAPGTYVLTKS